MFNACWLALRCAVVFVAFTLTAFSSSAQFSKLDTLGEGLAKKLKSGKFHMIAVADLTALDGSASGQGEYFASLISASIQRHGKKKTPVADHAAFDALLLRKHITAGNLSSAESLRDIAKRGNLDVVLTGTIEKSEDSYDVQVKAIQASDGAILAAQRVSFRRSDFTDSLSEPFTPTADYLVLKSFGPGVKPPACVRCPQPPYNDYARQEKISGTSLFDIMVSTEGRAVRIHPKRLIGYGLDEEAYEVIKRWQFKPAEKDGRPVAVVVEVEVTFHLY